MRFRPLELTPLLLIVVTFIVAVVMDTEPATEVLGAIAVAHSFVIYIPQAVLVWQMRNDYAALRSVSIPTYALMLSTATVWIIYGVFLDAFWVAVSTVLNIPIALTVMYLVWRARGIPRGETGEEYAI